MKLGDTSDMAAALDQEPSDGAQVPCWSALGRVVDEDPTHVWNDGDSNGMTVTCLILTGPFTGCEVAAMVSCPLGGGFESRPLRAGMRVLLQFLEGSVDGMVVALACVPGGKENPMPKAMAGIAIDEGGLQNEHLVAPPKGANVRFYVRGGAFLVRLKGAQAGYAGEFYVEGDDGDAEGFDNTFIRLALNPSTGKLSIKLKTAKGPEIAIDDGVASMTSPNGQNTIQVSDENMKIMGNTLYIGVASCVINGTVMINLPPGVPPLPAMSAIFGPIGISGLPSTSVFIGR